MLRPAISASSNSNSPESPKKLKLVLQTPKHKHTGSLITPKSSFMKFKPSLTLSSKSKPVINKFISPSSALVKLNTKHKHAFSEHIPASVKNSTSKINPKKASPERRSLWKYIQTPIKPETALKLFTSSLNTYESTEILNYPSIYYVGYGIKKNKTLTVNNFGFDDDKGDYKIIIGDHIEYRYEIKTILGKGSFGQVVKVFDHKNKVDLALKIIKNRPRFHQQAFEEVDILNYLKDKDPNDIYCVVHLQDNFIFRAHMVIII